MLCVSHLRNQLVEDDWIDLAVRILRHDACRKIVTAHPKF